MDYFRSFPNKPTQCLDPYLRTRDVAPTEVLELSHSFGPISTALVTLFFAAQTKWVSFYKGVYLLLLCDVPSLDS